MLHWQIYIEKVKNQIKWKGGPRVYNIGWIVTDHIRITSGIFRAWWLSLIQGHRDTQVWNYHVLIEFMDNLLYILYW